jgi:hypothetical protein
MEVGSLLIAETDPGVLQSFPQFLSNRCLKSTSSWPPPPMKHVGKCHVRGIQLRWSHLIS